MIPGDYLVPVMRCSPSLSTRVWTVGLDPREAMVVLERGRLTVDDVVWRVTLEGCDGQIQNDGRIQVRCDSPSEQFVYVPDREQVMA